ncbi:PepSY domain-containing protein [Streptomyces sp. JB150]|uniref:PepSY domain-containing protein n=1 Tax=Streptomyces sp. JB150 TaxID=2714844 RepID=UPI0014091724|nr:PepSY domain-containing protein [Streptomyces sp. JB150]QIJ64776.1 PepSY domain-containing protein [Streptomyces sp. JB150]
MKRNIVIAAVTATALLGGGAAVAFANGDDGAKGAVADGSADRAAASEVTAVEAIDAALKERAGTVVSVDLDDDRDEDGDDGGNGKRDVAAWEVDVLGSGSTSYTVRVDPASGKVLGTETDKDEDDVAKARALLKGADVDAREAARAAAAEGVVTSVDLDDEGRSAGWDVETAGESGQDWRVDLKTGKVTAERDDSGSETDSEED